MSRPTGPCPHGQLPRACYTCELEGQIDERDKEIAALRAESDRRASLIRQYEVELPKAKAEIAALRAGVWPN